MPKPIFLTNGFFSVIFKKSKSALKRTEGEQASRPKSVPSLSQVCPKSIPENVFLRILAKASRPRAITELMETMAEKNRTRFRKRVLDPLLKKRIIKMTLPDKPNSSKQRYVLTEKGQMLREKNK